jgi:hypothetical protein
MVKVKCMRAYSYLGVWCVLGGVALACSGTSFSSGGSSNAGSGGSGDTSSDGGEAGAQTRAGNSSGGTSNGNGGKGSGGSDVAGTDTGGTTSSGGVAGDVSVGGDLVSAGTTSSGGSAGTGPVAGAAGTAGTNGGPSVDLVCPKNQPSNGGSCKDGLQCTYGTDVRMQCRNTASCSDGKWTVNKAVCPDMHGCQNVVMGKQCDPQAPACALGDTGVFCVCAECGNAACSSQYAWACAGSGGGQACPKVVPNLGQACANVDVKCPYGSCDTGYPVTATCTAGFWNWEQGLCAQPL